MNIEPEHAAFIDLDQQQLLYLEFKFNIQKVLLLDDVESMTY